MRAFIVFCHLFVIFMLFNVYVWVTHDEWNYDTDDDWKLFPGDDFVPAPMNCVTYVAQQYTDLSWSDVCAVGDTWSMTPGQSKITVTPA